MIIKILPALVALSLPMLAQADVQSGKEKSVRCQACHGAAGKSVSPIYPNLAGQRAAYLAQALHDYQSGGRSGGQAEVMKAFVAGLSQGDIDDLADYYGSLKP